MERSTKVRAGARILGVGALLAALAATAVAQGQTRQSASSRRDNPRFVSTLRCIDFEGLARGARVSSVMTPIGPVAIRGFNPSFGVAVNAAIVFDSANPTGTDFDLGTPNETFGGPGVGEEGELGQPFQNDTPKGNLLIIAENLVDANGDGLIDTPDDADLLGEIVTIDFTKQGAVEFESLFLIDPELEKVPSTIRFYGPTGAQIDSIPLPTPGNNGVIRVIYNVQNVRRVEVRLNGSAAIDDICFRQMIDCNGNGIQDSKDILAGTSLDCDANGVPDECQPDCDGDGIPDACEPDCDKDGLPDDCDGPDCNANGRPDNCDIATGTSPDCNANGVPDECDIAGGFSPDCNFNGVPDECEPDCDGDGIPDACEGPDCNSNGLPDNCDIASGTSQDCNANGIPDECEPDCDGDGIPDACDGPDCNGNGLSDNCDIASGTSQDTNGNGVPDECECLGKIGDRIWNDIDRDGIQDPSEPGIESVTVLLKDLLGNVVATDVTDNKGFYQFPNLCGGDYVVCVDETTLPPEFVASPCNAGGDDTLDNDCSPASVNLPDDHACDLTIDFGYNSPCAGLIGDFVWYDLDRDGIQEAGEPGIEGVTVILKDGMGNTLTSVTTSAFGFYSFMGLCAGTYEVCVDESTLPPGLVASPCNAGGDTVDNDCSPAMVVLTTDNSQDVTIDFGYNEPCTGIIGDYVWFDADADGIQDPNEFGIEGVFIELKDAGGNVIAGVTTGSDGDYRFENLCAGTFQVCVDASTLPPGYTPTLCNQGSDDEADNDCSPVTVVLTTDHDTDLSIDFGYVFTHGGGGEGCTPGYWRQTHHFDSWPAPYTPTTLFSSVFEDAFPGMTLLEVVEQGGGGLNALGRHTVAALLNGASGGVDYDLTDAEVITLFNDLFPATTPEYNALKDYFENFNEQGCPLN